MLVFTAFMWMATVVVGMLPGKRWHDESLVFCQAEVSRRMSTGISITSSNSTPMEATCFPMDYSNRFRFYSQSEPQRGFTWVEIPSSLHSYTNPNLVSGASGSVILHPDLATAVTDIEGSDMSVLRIGLQHQTLEDWCWASTATERVILEQPSMTSTTAQHVTLPHPSTVTLPHPSTVTLPHPSTVTLPHPSTVIMMYPSTVTATTTLTRTLTRITTITRETAPTLGRQGRPHRTRTRSSGLATSRRTGRSGLSTPRRSGRTSRNAPRSHRWAARVFEAAMSMEVDEVEE